MEYGFPCRPFPDPFLVLVLKGFCLQMLPLVFPPAGSDQAASVSGVTATSQASAESDPRPGPSSRKRGAPYTIRAAAPLPPAEQREPAQPARHLPAGARARTSSRQLECT